MKKNRIPFIDVLRAFAIIFIVLGHAYCQSTHCEIVVKILYSFHVPLFFLISGYLFSFKNDSFIKFLKKKSIRILIPYFIWSLIFLIPYYLFGIDASIQLGKTSSFNIIQKLLNILIGNGNQNALNQNSSLWFLPTLFSMEIIYYFIIKYVNKNPNKKYLVFLMVLILAFITNLSRIILPFGISNVLILGMFFYVGYLMKNCKIISDRKKIRFDMALIFLLLGLYAGVNNYVKISYMDYLYGNMLLMFFAGFCLSFFLIYVSHYLSKNRMMQYIGRNTMSILIFHKIIILLFQIKFGKISELFLHSNIFVELVLGLIISIIAILISLIVSYILRRFFPILIGENKVI